MEWSDQAFFLMQRRYGERALLIELFTQEHGRKLGYMKNGFKANKEGVISVADKVQVVWKGRTEDQLGSFVLDPMVSYGGRLLGSLSCIYVLQVMVFHLHNLPEGVKYSRIFEAFELSVKKIGVEKCSKYVAVLHLVRFENILLAECGYGIDISGCPVSGERSTLTYVSPKTLRAVSASAGEQYKNKLLNIPRFMVEQNYDDLPCKKDLASALNLLDFALVRYLYQPVNRKMPFLRAKIINWLK